MKSFITVILIVGVMSSLKAQWRIDIVAGISPGGPASSLPLTVNRHDPHEEFTFNVGKVEPQYLAGVKAQVQLTTPFFLESGLYYTRSKSEYNVTYTIIDAEHPVRDHIMNETDHTLALPVNVGVNLGIVDVTSGLRLMKSIHKSSELTHLSGFVSDENLLSTGWQASVGVALFRTRVGIEYQGSFRRVGTGIYVHDQPLELNHVPGRVMLTIQQSF